MKIDLNCDLGEATGNDEAIMPYITSANIACGFHAGDPSVMQATIRLAKKYGVAIGAHPGWNDKEGFGRREMAVPIDEVRGLILYQIGALAGMARGEGVDLVHVKAHGALYNQAAQDIELATTIAGAVKSFSVGLTLVGLAGSRLIEAGLEAGLRVAAEGFPDRVYNPDGTLMSRSKASAVIESPEDVARNALKLIRDGIMFGDQLVQVDTLCLHGDNIHAAENARVLKERLMKDNIAIEKLNK